MTPDAASEDDILRRWVDYDLEEYVEAPSLPREKIVAVAQALAAATIPFAFGGAIALEYVGTPRGSWDIDTNLFVPESRAWDVLQAFRPVIADMHVGRALEAAQRDGQIRLAWDDVALDLYFSYDPFHELCRERSLSVTFDGEPVRVLSAEDLVILKVLADRDRDWADITDILDCQGSKLDLDYARRWLEILTGGNRAKLRRFEAAVSER